MKLKAVIKNDLLFMQQANWPAAFADGVCAVRTYGGADVGMRTLLDALVPAVVTLSGDMDVAQLAKVWGIVYIFFFYSVVYQLCIDTIFLFIVSLCVKAAQENARQGMEATKAMESLAGRANYVSDEQISGTPDPGAYAVFLAFSAASAYFDK